MEQSEKNNLVVNNMKLVYYAFEKLAKNDITKRYKEDLISEGMIGLVKVAKFFDKSKGFKFNTFAMRCIKNEMFMFLRKLNKESCEISLYAPIHKDKDNNEICLVDIIGEENANPEMEIDKKVFLEFMEKQSVIDKKIILAICKGYTQKEIAKVLQMKQPTISRRVLKLKKKFQASI